MCIGGDNLLCDDNCPSVPNLDQTDTDNDGVGDACEGTPPPVPALGFLGRGLLIASTLIAGLIIRRQYNDQKA
jgi:hypothetical protein